ncbi:hypothetical protein ISN44_As10g000810 [Arabidopsis suecica]|uniref:Retrovirus-related Pol polyprotein from transposon TNT 1-94-like beta-barrel domain-containing protein n=1 Tax=Arabidopsis suecica TaxID=45249 RepID=A0A8T1ZSD1_ARASU|nr:hypothetical protein ISN44_As10g000810 [Arabidopsis suecica]
MWIYGTITESLLSSVLKSECSARELWLTLENLFRDNKEARAIQLENELRTLQIGDLSVYEYSQKMKSISDMLTNVNSPVSDRALVMHLLNGLNSKFDSIINVIKHRTPPCSFSDARSMLPSFPSWNWPQQQQPIWPQQNWLQPQQIQRQLMPSQSGILGPLPQNNNGAAYLTQTSMSPPPQSGFIPTVLASALNTMTLQDPMDNGWYMDSGATAHLTSQQGTISLSPTSSSTSFPLVTVGNGKTLPVTAKGDTYFPTSTRPLHLQNVFLCHGILKNLVSVRQFTRDNSCTVEFDPFGFLIKNFKTRTPIIQCDSSGPLYSFTLILHHHPNKLSSPPLLQLLFGIAVLVIPG